MKRTGFQRKSIILKYSCQNIFMICYTLTRFLYYLLKSQDLVLGLGSTVVDVNDIWSFLHYL